MSIRYDSVLYSLGLKNPNRDHWIYERDIRDNHLYFTCYCGWVSEPFSDEREAEKSFTKHASPLEGHDENKEK